MQLNFVGWNKERHGNPYHRRLDLVESLGLVSGSLVQWDWVRTRPGCALVRAGARRGWSEGAGAHWTRVDWEQVEDTRTLHTACSGWELLAPHTSLRRVKKSTDCLHSIKSTWTYELCSQDWCLYCIIALLLSFSSVSIWRQTGLLHKVLFWTDFKYLTVLCKAFRCLASSSV